MFETQTPTPVSPVPPPVVRSKASSRMGTVILGVAALVAIGGIAFAAGRVTAPATSAAATTGNGRQAFGGNGTGVFGNGAAGNGATGGIAGRFGGDNGITLRGTVTAVSATSLTLKLSTGTTVTIPIDSSTTFHRQQAATNTDVASGTTVLVEVSGFGARFNGTGGAGSANGSPAPAAGSFVPPSFDANRAPGASGAPGQFPGIGTARDITIAAGQ